MLVNEIHACTFQGPNLVTLDKYQEVAEELLINIAHLANPRVSKHWFGRVDRWVSTQTSHALRLSTNQFLCLSFVFIATAAAESCCGCCCWR